jgi:type I restriction enzyme R subunit
VVINLTAQSLGDAHKAEEKAREVEIRLAARLQRHKGNLRFVALGQRLEELKPKGIRLR